MTEMISVLLHFRQDEEGATLIEYALIGALIAVTCFLSVSLVGGNLQQLFITVCNEVTKVTSGAPAC